MAFKMKGFPMQKGTGSYLKEESAARMKKEAAARMKKASMAAQRAEGGGGSKPDFLDLDGDGNKTESMKSAASAAKQRRGRVERSIKRANKAADKYNTYVSGKGKKETYYVNDEEMTRYGLSEKDMKKAKRLKKRADKREAKAEKLVSKYNKKNAPTTQKSEEPKAVTAHNKRIAEILGSYHGKGADTTGYAATGEVMFDNKKAKKEAERAIKKSQKQAVKEAKAEGFDLTFNNK